MLFVWSGLALVLCVSGASAFLVGALPATAQAQPRKLCTRPMEAVPFKETSDMVVSMAGLAVSLTPAIQQGFKALSANSTAIPVDILSASTIALRKALQGDLLVKRECCAEFRGAVELARDDEQNPCVLVYGPRGCGKTSLVQAAMQGMGGALNMPYSGDGKDLDLTLERALLELGGLEIDRESVRTGNCLRAILAGYNLVYKRRPIFVIEIYERMEPAALGDLLLAIKQLGFEEGLATFVVVVSASRSALGLTIDVKELRVEGYQARDFSTKEACEYVSRRLDAEADLAQFIVEQVGTRAMDLVSVCSKCRRGVASREEYLERVAAYRAQRLKDARFALRGFLGIARRNGAAFDKQSGGAFFRRLLEGIELDDGDAEVAFGFQEPAALLAALGMYHAFVVDPFDHSVSMQSHFMRIVLTEYVESEFMT